MPKLCALWCSLPETTTELTQIHQFFKMEVLHVADGGLVCCGEGMFLLDEKNGRRRKRKACAGGGGHRQRRHGKSRQHPPSH